MFVYKLYDYLLISSIYIPFLEEVTVDTQNNDPKIRLRVHFDNDYCTSTGDENIKIDFGCSLTYVIDKQDDFIDVYTDSAEKVVSSLFNIPLAVYMMLKGAVMLHASSIEIGGKIYAFIGPKGIGKSTLTFVLSKYYNFFSDDTLLIQKKNGNLYARRSSCVMKLCADTYEHITQKADFEEYRHNIAGKAYIVPEEVGFKASSCGNGDLATVFFLEPPKENVCHQQKITSPLSQKIKLIDSIVGVGIMREEWFLCEEVNELLDDLCKNVDMYQLRIPRGLDYIQRQIATFVETGYREMGDV